MHLKKVTQQFVLGERVLKLNTDVAATLETTVNRRVPGRQHEPFSLTPNLSAGQRSVFLQFCLTLDPELSGSFSEPRGRAGAKRERWR